MFRFHNIKTIEEANAFLAQWVAGYNRRFAVIPQDAELHWHIVIHVLVQYVLLFPVRIHSHQSRRPSYWRLLLVRQKVLLTPILEER